MQLQKCWHPSHKQVKIKNYSIIKDKLQNWPPYKVLMKYKIYVHTLSLFSLFALICDAFSSVSEELDPSRVCKGKGAVTLRATLVHVDDGDCIAQEQNLSPAESE